MTTVPGIEGLLRVSSPQVLGALVRRFGHFDACEDAVQRALATAAQQWPKTGVPDNPRAWLITVASRRLMDQLRSDDARRRREETVLARTPVIDLVTPAADAVVGIDTDDTLTLLFLCCHPAISAPSQLALTLRAVGGLTTLEIARAFFVPEATMAQRISRAKQRIKEAGATFEMPPVDERNVRLGVVLHVLYLIFNEGYTTSSGPALQRGELTSEAIRLTRLVHAELPDDAEVSGLLALMVLTDARRAARTSSDGSIVPLAEQDRASWDRRAIEEGVELITRTLSAASLGPYQVQAAIAAVHDEAERAEDTDWAQVMALYEVLHRISPNPMATLNHALAVAMVRGPRAGLAMLDELESDDRMAGHHRLIAMRAHLLELAGDLPAAKAAYRLAARRTTSTPEQRHLDMRAARLNAV